MNYKKLAAFFLICTASVVTPVSADPTADELETLEQLDDSVPDPTPQTICYFDPICTIEKG